MDMMAITISVYLAVCAGIAAGVIAYQCRKYEQQKGLEAAWKVADAMSKYNTYLEGELRESRKIAVTDRDQLHILEQPQTSA